MAKDPAMLWYWADWHSGTVTFSRFLKGCYMDLLHAQFNSGRLTLEEIRTVLGSDFGQAWPTLQKKFAVDETGKYFNERLELEKNKRAVYTQSRRNNLDKKPHMDTHMDQHMDSHMEDRDRNENVVKKQKERKKKNEIVYPFVTEEFTTAWSNWLTYRGEIRKPYRSELSEQTALRKLSQHDEQTAIKMIYQSIENQWQGIFEVKSNGKSTSKNDRTEFNQNEFTLIRSYADSAKKPE